MSGNFVHLKRERQRIVTHMKQLDAAARACGAYCLDIQGK